MTIYITRDGTLIPLSAAERAKLDFMSSRARVVSVPRFDMLPLLASDYTPSEGGAQEAV